ncbi:polysaccharide chain length determinant protein, PEP-CTERM locus subfamily [Colwellia chukchiensis]|uniref:Polysaccharide chain length determinant protein, PEP-CTERM locus subfamily n=1 Tax=Colwellia chukchiensis TaxID=641665 RepID=A0A1H7SD08_9GAMM|nr:XrtA system polysaccharide chain length determinant [Colwellia chukchiensis]SEL70353.1 polysaccharide chain length determinant protein, PEP-CTERM locus subfamily [Colwellia chukchiensis]
MQEIIEQVIDYLKGIWLKRRFIIVSTWLICPLAWLYVAQLDNVYESEARVYADTQSILGPLLKGLTVKTDPDVQIRLMIKTLLSRPNLERITRMTDLDVQANTPAAYEALIDRLKSNINIRKTGGRKENIFTITYQDSDPEMAKNVVNSALTVFIENTLGENRSDSTSAQKFLDSQIKDYENRLLAAESRLTDFKQKYSGVLPDQYGGYYQKLNVVKEQLKITELTLLEQETQLKSAKAQLTASPVNNESPQNNIKNSNSIQTTYDGRIAELEATLDSLQLRYTEMHPDVKEVKRRLEHLTNQRSKEIEEYLSATGSGDSSKLSTSQNPVIQQLQIQVNQLENQVASTRVRANDYRQQVKDLESKIHILPEIEAELTSLNRGYQITKSKYEELLNRKETAQLAQQADENTNPIRFRVIDPPRAPTEPAGPKRILFLIIVTVLGFGVGVGLSLLFSQINPVVTSSSQVAKLTGIPVFGVVSATENLGLQRWHKRKTLIFIISNCVLLIMLAGFIAYAIAPNAVLAPIRGVL